MYSVITQAEARDTWYMLQELELRAARARSTLEAGRQGQSKVLSVFLSTALKHTASFGVM